MATRPPETVAEKGPSAPKDSPSLRLLNHPLPDVRIGYAVGILRLGKGGFDYAGFLGRAGYNSHQFGFAEITASVLGVVDPKDTSVEGSDNTDEKLAKRLAVVAPEKTSTRWVYYAKEDPSRSGDAVRHSLVFESRKPGIVVATGFPPPDNILGFKYKNMEVTTDESLKDIRQLIAQSGGRIMRIALVDPKLVVSHGEVETVDYRTFVEETHTDLKPPFGNWFMRMIGQRSKWEASPHGNMVHVYVTKPGEQTKEAGWMVDKQRLDGLAVVIRTVTNPQKPV